MKFIIDLIDNIREEIGDDREYSLCAGLLKRGDDDSLVYAGEAPLGSFDIDDTNSSLLFKVDKSSPPLSIETIVSSLLILDMKSMMYSLKVDVNIDYRDIEVVGFGKNIEQKKYFLFIKLS